jgi:quercetin 2,3-dioxygenase
MTTTSGSALRGIATIVDPPSGPVGDGHRARRLIDGQDPATTDPFLAMAEDWMSRDSFGRHSHRGIETVTIVLEGAVEHFDSAGHGGVIDAGDAQWITAGRGVIHAETPLPGMLSHTLQLWVNLPASAKMTEPRYQDLRASALPVRSEPGVVIRILSGISGEVASPTLNHAVVTAIDARIEPGASFIPALEPEVNAFVMVVEGQILVGLDSASITAGQLAWLTRSDDPDGSAVRFEAREMPSRLLLFAGQLLREPSCLVGRSS